MGGIIPSLILSCVALFLFSDAASSAVLDKTSPKELPEANSITIPFAENKGQIEDPNILFYSNTFACRVSVNRDGSIGYSFRGNKFGKEKQLREIRENIGGALKISPSGKQKAIAKVNLFKGKDPEKWVTDITTFNSIDMGEIYQGVSLRLRACGNNVEKIFSVDPGADPKKIQLNILEANALRLNENGELEVKTGPDSMRFTKPVAYQRINGRKKLVDVAYTVNGTSYGFIVAAYDKTKKLIIDPLITAKFQGTADTKTMPTCMAADGQGNIYVAGFSANQYAVFKFDAKLNTLMGSALFGTLSWSEEGDPSVYDIAVDQDNAVYLVGGTTDKDFPVTIGAFDADFNGGPYSWLNSDGFVIKFNADLDAIQSSTFIGEDGYDVANGIAIARDGTVYVVGETSNPGPNATPFPTSPDAYDTNSGREQKRKAFVIHLDGALQTRIASTLLGYNGDLNAGDSVLYDRAYDVVIDAQGAIVVAGITRSEHFPVTGTCADGIFQGDSEAFISKFDPDLKYLTASTFLGGADREKANVLGITTGNEIVVAGWTMSSDFPVVQGNYDTSYNSEEDGFVSRLSSDLTSIRASTFLGGNGHEQVSDMVIGNDGTVFLCGGTGSSDFPVTENFHDISFNGGMSNDFYMGDGFLTVFDHTLTTLSASAYLGGNWFDHSTAILRNNDDIIVAGETRSSNFPYMAALTGQSDAFICRFNENEAPGPRPFSGRPGHWQSKDNGTATDIYLDVNICDDGSFSGIWKVYLCPPNGGLLCVLPGDAPSSSVSGKIDFPNWNGTITLDDKNKDFPFSLVKQVSDELVIRLNSDESAGDWPAGVRFFLYSQGECEAGTCPDSPGSSGDGGGGGGGGGGCFLNSMVGSSGLSKINKGYYFGVASEKDQFRSNVRSCRR